MTIHGYTEYVLYRERSGCSTYWKFIYILSCFAIFIRFLHIFVAWFLISKNLFLFMSIEHVVTQYQFIIQYLFFFFYFSLVCVLCLLHMAYLVYSSYQRFNVLFSSANQLNFQYNRNIIDGSCCFFFGCSIVEFLLSIDCFCQ